MPTEAAVQFEIDQQTHQLTDLIVDLEALVKTDLWLESLLALIKRQPGCIFRLPLWLLKGQAYLQLAQRAPLDVSILPYREELVQYLKAERALGRTTVLAAANNPAIARQVADHLDCFDGVVAGEFGGDEEVDGFISGRKQGFWDHLEALRPQHWSKNLLIFIPLLAAHSFGEFALLGKALLAFVAFGCFASAGYVTNDLLDLSADRHHRRKRYRPFASGDLPLGYALGMIPALFALGCLIGALVSPLFVAVALLYFGLSIAYSLQLKKIALLDVTVLAGLYTLRLVAGSAAVGIWASPWLLAFSTFLFFSLALVKRYAELSANRGRARGYEQTDLELVAAMGIASGYVAILVLALYINSEKAHFLYQRYEVLWFLCVLLMYWISHVWLSAHRGKMPDDPVVFAARDRTSRILLLLMAVTTVVAL